MLITQLPNALTQLPNAAVAYLLTPGKVAAMACPDAPGSGRRTETGSSGRLRLYTQFPGPVQDDCCVPKDGPAPGMPRRRRNLSQKTPPAPCSRGGLPGSSRAVSPSTDTARSAAFPDRGSTQSSGHRIRVNGLSRCKADTPDRSRFRPSLPQP